MNLKAISQDAFVYAFPMLEQVKTMNGMIEFSGTSFNQADFNRTLPWENVGMPIVAPNLTSMTGGILIDATYGPVTIEIPEVEDRYIVYQCIDGFTHNFYYMGTRADGGAAGRFTFHRKGQRLPDLDATPVEVETDHAVIVIRIDIRNPSEQERLWEIMDAIKVIDAPADLRPYPAYDPDDALSPRFARYINDLLTEAPESETELFERFGQIGILRDVVLTEEQENQVQAGIDAAMEVIKEQGATATALGNGWLGATPLFGTRDFLDGNYLNRAIGAYFGLWGNSREEANYFLSYVEGVGDIRFTPGDLPPLTDVGFWSITIHDADMLVRPNEYDSYVITMDQMVFDEDGGIRVRFSREPEQGNWLYAPGEKMAILIRTYQPDQIKIADYVPPPFEARSG